MNRNTAALFACLLVFVGLVYSLGGPFPSPYPEWPAQESRYHNFADRRACLGLANAGDVLSNLPFVAVGLAGILAITKRGEQAARTGWERATWIALFAGIAWVGFGSSWYHLSPSNASLVWDRLPMAFVFGLMIAIVIHERISARLARWALWPLLGICVGSVAYWAWTEGRGRGDIRPYFLVQGLASALLPLILLLWPAKRYTRSKDWWWLALAYLLAKGFEGTDRAVFHSLGGVVSGHTLKHLAAAAGTASLTIHCWKRQGKSA